jgi:hypothetical protein
MSNVFKLVRTSNEATVAVSKGVANDAVRGVITGLALCYFRSDGTEEVVFTGVYADDSNKALNAAMRLTWRLRQAQEDKVREVW